MDGTIHGLSTARVLLWLHTLPGMMAIMKTSPWRRATKVVSCVLVWIGFVALPFTGFASTYYADGTCTVQGDGTSAECATDSGGAGAFAQINAGLASLEPGDVLQLAAGVYDQRIQIQNSMNAPAGIEGHPITIRGAGTGETVIRGDKLDATTVIVQRSFWTLEDMTVQNGKADDPEAQGGCVKVQGDIEGVVLRQLEMDGQKRSAMRIGLLCVQQRTLCPQGTLIEDVLSYDHLVASEGDAHCVSLNYASAEEFGVRDTVIRRVTAYGCSGDGVQLVNPKDGGGYSAINTLIEDCTFYRAYDVADEENAIDAKGPRGLTIRGNTMYGFRPTPTSQSGAVVIVHHAASDVMIENNIIYEGAQSIRIGKGSYQGEGHPTGVVIRNNVIYDATRAGAGDSPGGKGNGITIAEVTDVKILHNTIVDSEGTGIEILEGAKEIVLQGNIVVGSGDDAHELSVANPADTTVSYSLIWGNVGSGTVDNADDITALCETCLNADPLFVDRTAHDYHLAAESPAIDAGVPHADVVTDLEGSARDDTPDLGAYEEAVSPPPVPDEGTPPVDEEPEGSPEIPPVTAEPPPVVPDLAPDASASKGSSGGCGVASGSQTSPGSFTLWTLLALFLARLSWAPRRRPMAV